MKALFIGLLVLCAAMAQTASDDNMEQLWDSWKSEYGKSYSSSAEDAHRFAIFCDNYQFIQQYNAAHTTSQLALNQFSDLTNEEFRALYTGLHREQFEDSSDSFLSGEPRFLKQTSNTEQSSKASSAASSKASSAASSKASSKASSQASSQASQASSAEASKESSAASSKASSKASSQASQASNQGSQASNQGSQASNQGSNQESSKNSSKNSEANSESKSKNSEANSESKSKSHSSAPAEEEEEEEEEVGTPWNDESSFSNEEQPTPAPAAPTNPKQCFQMNNYPSSWNWVSQGALSPVQDQKSCGSCWAFSTAAAVEALHQINTGNLVKFSEQQMIDCDTKEHGCNGGVPDYAMTYVAQYGLETEQDYPYVKKAGTCQYDASKATKGLCTGYCDVPKNSVNSLKSAIYQQPTVVLVDASSVLQHYKSGVIDASSQCGPKVDHAVLAVGYGNQEGSDAFMVRNSWSTKWGVNGYFYISTNDDNNGAGTCGILHAGVFPTGRKNVNQ